MPAPACLTARPIAHRAYHDAAAGRVENTLSAVRAAMEKRFAIEVDLQVTRDGAVVVFHDDTVDRLLEGTGRVDALTRDALQALPFKMGCDRVPTLEALLATVGGAVPLVIEMKSDFTGNRRLEQAVVPILAAYDGPVVVMSFDPDSMAEMRRLAPHIARGIVADRYTDLDDWGFLSAERRFRLRHLLDVRRAGASFVSFDIGGLPSLPTSLFRAFRGPLITWTIRTPAQRAKASRCADQITFEGFDPDADPAPARDPLALAI